MPRVLALGSIFKVDDDDSGSVYTSITLLLDFQRPSRTRERVDNTALEDTLSTQGAGIEIAGDVTFAYFSDPGSTQDTIFRTLFAAKTQLLWQLLLPDAGTETFEGIIMAIEPEPFARDQYLKEKITIARQTAITAA